jgi:hypothetical protein
MGLDSRRYLAAVEVDGRLIIVGVTPERITPIAHWRPESDDEPGHGDLSFGGLDLEDAGPDFAFDPSPKKSPSPAPKTRADLKEPAFYRGKTEEEEAESPSRIALDLDDKEFDDPGSNDDFLDIAPGKRGK